MAAAQTPAIRVKRLTTQLKKLPMGIASRLPKAYIPATPPDTPPPAEVNKNIYIHGAGMRNNQPRVLLTKVTYSEPESEEET